ncbi:ATP-binding response regulator, partial [Singulisphaera rosea]
TLASIGDAVIATDELGRVRFMNPVAESLTGWSQDDAAGRSVLEVGPILDGQSPHAPPIALERLVDERAGVGFADHSLLMARDGRELPIEVNAARIREDSGRVSGVVMVFRDVTERQRGQDELRLAKEAAEDANRAKDQFLAVLSHELRTPLNPILLAVTSMLERQDAVEELRTNLEMIRQYVGLQAQLIDDLLDVMRIVRGKMPLNWEVTDCNQLVQRAVEVCRSELLGKELRLDLDVAAPRRHVNADPARLQQVLWNLVKNAVKFTPQSGVITIRTRNRVDPDDREFLVLEVTDTGIGIDPAILPAIFDPFQQGEVSITRRFGGLGLGLAISKGIIEGLGGVLIAESGGPGQGATFRIELQTSADPGPEDSETSDHPADSPDSADIARRKILLVEDEPATLRLLAKLLRGLGHEVTAAETIAAALEAEAEGDFDLIISDIGLPDGSGLRLMQQVIARRGPVSAIALTGYGMEEDIRQSRDAGFLAHMTKPIDFTKLQALIRQLTS